MRFHIGANAFEYTDESDSRAVLIEHRYQESSSVQPLEPPAAPTFPSDKTNMRHDNATFLWPAVVGAEEYHVVVSLREDMRIPYRSQLDTIIASPSLVNPWLGLFSPGTTYCESSRACRSELKQLSAEQVRS